MTDPAIRHEWTDPEYGTYHLAGDQLFTHAFAGPPVPTDPDGGDGVAVLREAGRLAARVAELEAGISDLEAERDRLRVLVVQWQTWGASVLPLIEVAVAAPQEENNRERLDKEGGS